MIYRDAIYSLALYGPHLHDWVSKLNTMTWTKEKSKYKEYEVDTPFGKLD